MGAGEVTDMKQTMILMKKDSDPFSGDYKAYLESLRKNANKGGAYKIFS